MQIVTETKAFIAAALAGDPGLASLAIAGNSPETLAVSIARGELPKSFGGVKYGGGPAFDRQTLVELIVRMQRIRWSRYDDFMLTIPEHPRDDWKRMSAKHARLTCGLECGVGWHDMLDATFSWLHEIAPDAEWRADQIKEKFATLRFYWHGDLPPLGDAIIDAAEHLSRVVCETCGAPGTLRKQRGWWRLRCDEHGDQ